MFASQGALSAPVETLPPPTYEVTVRIRLFFLMVALGLAGCSGGSNASQATSQSTAAPSPSASPTPSPTSSCDVAALIAATDAVAADEVAVAKVAANYAPLVQDAVKAGLARDISGILPRLQALDSQLTSASSAETARTYADARAACQ